MDPDVPSISPGDMARIEQLWRDVLPKVRAGLRSGTNPDDLDDLLQDLFLALCRRRDLWDQTPGYVVGWGIRAGRGKRIDRYRSDAARRSRDVKAGGRREFDDEFGQADDALLAADLWPALHSLLRQEDILFVRLGGTDTTVKARTLAELPEVRQLGLTNAGAVRRRRADVRQRWFECATVVLLTREVTGGRSECPVLVKIVRESKGLDPERLRKRISRHVYGLAKPRPKTNEIRRTNLPLPMTGCAICGEYIKQHRRWYGLVLAALALRGWPEKDGSAPVLASMTSDGSTDDATEQGGPAGPRRLRDAVSHAANRLAAMFAGAAIVLWLLRRKPAGIDDFDGAPPPDPGATDPDVTDPDPSVPDTPGTELIGPDAAGPGLTGPVPPAPPAGGASRAAGDGGFEPFGDGAGAGNPQPPAQPLPPAPQPAGPANEATDASAEPTTGGSGVGDPSACAPVASVAPIKRLVDAYGPTGWSLLLLLLSLLLLFVVILTNPGGPPAPGPQAVGPQTSSTTQPAGTALPAPGGAPTGAPVTTPTASEGQSQGSAADTGGGMTSGGGAAPVPPPPPPGPGPCDQRPAGAGPYRPFVGVGGVVCWLAGTTWRPLNMSGLRAEPQDIWAVEVTGGRALFFTATDSYVWGTIVNGAGDISGWHRFFERADGYSSGFNIHRRQPVRAVATNPNAIELYAVGLDEVVWYRAVAVSAFAQAGGWRTLLDPQTFPGDGGRFYMPQSLTALYDGRIMARAKDNATYESCYAGSTQFRWVRMGFACPPFVPGPR